MAQLMRREVDPTNRTQPLAIPVGAGAATTNSRALLNFAVAFNLSFTMTTLQPAGQPDVYTPGLQVADTDGAITAAPERIRAVSIMLAARTPQEDPTLPWVRAACAINWSCYQVFPKPVGAANPMGAARVRWLRSEVFVPNIAYEGY
jgi:hypothetical protein